MSEERQMVLKMLKDGKVTVEEADALLEALEGESPATSPAPPGPDAGGDQAQAAEAEPTAGGEATDQPDTAWQPRTPRTPRPPRPPRPPRAPRPPWSGSGEHTRNLAEEIRNIVRQSLAGARPGKVAGEAIREAVRSLREDLRPEEMVRGLFDLASAEEQLDLSAGTSPGSRLIVRNPRGDVRLQAGAGSDVRVRARKQVWWNTPEGAQDLMGQVRVEVGPQNGDVVVDVRQDPDSISRLRFRVDLAIEVPEGVGATVDVKSGDIRIEGLSGDVELRVASGDVTVGSHRGAVRGEIKSGDVRITEADGCTLQVQRGDVAVERIRGAGVFHVSSGDLSVSEGEGDLKAQVLHGDVELSRVTGNLQLQVASGDVSVEDAQGDLEASVQSGDLEIAARGPRRLKLKVMSGDLDMRLSSLPSGATGDIDVMSGDVSVVLGREVRTAITADVKAGDLDVEVPLGEVHKSRGHVDGVLGSRDATLTLRVMSGDLSISQE